MDTADISEVDVVFKLTVSCPRSCSNGQACIPCLDEQIQTKNGCEGSCVKIDYYTFIRKDSIGVVKKNLPCTACRSQVG